MLVDAARQQIVTALREHLDRTFDGAGGATVNQIKAAIVAFLKANGCAPDMITLEDRNGVAGFVFNDPLAAIMLAAKLAADKRAVRTT